MNVEASLQTVLRAYENLNNAKQPDTMQKQIFAKVMAQGIQSNREKVIVKAGDTVSQLAVNYNTSVDAIVRMNQLKNPNLILTGQTLQITNKANNNATTEVKQQSVVSKMDTKKDGFGHQVVNYAKKFLGDAYVWGQAKPGTFDCSGLVSYVYQKFGVKVPHLAQAQADQTQRISTKDAQAGDLLFWQNKQGRVYHVAISMGNGHYINALSPQYGVRIDGMAKPADFAGKI